MEFDFSVIVVTYHPVKEKLFATLNSIIMQKGIRFEIVIADDGSREFHESDIHSFMQEHDFCDYKVVAHEQNQGTVKNLRDGTLSASGKYIKDISPGDFLYDENVLSDLYSFMEENKAKVAFGDMVFYSFDDKLNVFPMRHPGDDDLYLPDSPRYSPQKVMKHLVVYNDLICGASVACERETFLSGLETICDTVIYAEDVVMQLFALQKVRIFRFPHYIVWYEYGSGISTNTQLGFSKRINEDFYRFYKLLMKLYEGNPIVCRACRKWTVMMMHGRLTNIAYRFVCVDQNLFSLQRKKKLRSYQPKDCDRQAFARITGE